MKKCIKCSFDNAERKKNVKMLENTNHLHCAPPPHFSTYIHASNHRNPCSEEHAHFALTEKRAVKAKLTANPQTEVTTKLMNDTFHRVKSHVH